MKAPADGIVTEISHKKSGTELKKGDSLMTISSTQVVLLRVNNAAGAFRCGMNVKITGGSGAQQTELIGRVVGCDQALSSGKGTGSAYIAPEAYEGMAKLRNLKVSAASVHLENVLLISKSALKNENGAFYVDVLREGHACRRYVTVGINGTSEVWLLDGAAEGDVLIVD